MSARFPSRSIQRLSLSGELGISDLGILLPEARPPMPHDSHDGFDLLADLSQVTNIDGSFASVAALVRARQAHYEQIAPADRPSGRIAIWAPGDVSFGICRILEQLVHGCLPFEVSVVREEAEALSLLRDAGAPSPAPAERIPPAGGATETPETATPSANRTLSAFMGLPRTA